MPLNTQVIRNGEPLQLPWGNFHIVAMVIAASIDSGKGPFNGMGKGKINENYKNLTGFDYPEDFHSCDDIKQDKNGNPQMCVNCGHVLPIIIGPQECFHIASYPAIGQTPLNSGGYTLENAYEFIDAKDGEVFQLLPGDELVAFRSMK